MAKKFGAIKQAEIIVFGAVQGIFFRRYTQQVARNLGLSGSVRNMPDSTVYILAEGTEEKLMEFISWCRQGPSAAKVDKIQTKWRKATQKYKEFEVI